MRELSGGRSHLVTRKATSSGELPRRVSQYVARHPASFLVVTDRPPVARSGAAPADDAGEMPDHPVTVALEALAIRLRGRWVGRLPSDRSGMLELPIHHVALDQIDIPAYEEQAGSYIWPLYHDLTTPFGYDADCRRAYRRVNIAFATAAVQQAAQGASVWVHDYQLQLVPALIRAARPDLRIGFYLESAFPAPDLVRRLPMWRELVAGLLGADHLGFQNLQSAENFLRLAGSEAGRLPTIGVYPTAVDTAALLELSRQHETSAAAEALRTQLGSPSSVILSISPVDEAQAIEQRLQIFEMMFRERRLVPGETVVVQILVTDRNQASAEQCDLIAQKVARINGQFASVGRACVHSIVDRPAIADRVVLYQAADVMVATPWREAATLPALEFVVAARPGSALVLSEFSGTADMLPDAFIVNPHDNEATGAAVIGALQASESERTRRMRLMRVYPTSYNHHGWAMNFLLSMHSNVERDPDIARDTQDVVRWPGQAGLPFAERDADQYLNGM